MLSSFNANTVTNTALINWVAVGAYDKVKQGLQKLSWDPNVKNEDGVTPAHKAAERNDLKMLKLLVDAGARLNVQDIFGTSPLICAQENKSYEIEKYITEVLSESNPRNRFHKL